MGNSSSTAVARREIKKEFVSSCWVGYLKSCHQTSFKSVKSVPTHIRKKEKHSEE